MFRKWIEQWRSLDSDVKKIIVVFGTIYFVQKMGGLISLPFQYLQTDILKFNESQMSYFAAFTSLAWYIKPLWGYISDNYPIFGYRRKPYIVIMAVLAAGFWFALAYAAFINAYDYWSLLILFNLSAMAYAFVDVVCDGLMVEKGNEKNLTENFVSIQWFFFGIAAVIVGLTAGYLQNSVKAGNIGYGTVFFLAGLFPLLTAIVALKFAQEKKRETIVKKTVGLAVLKEAFKSKIFWILTGFLFFWNFSPSFGSAMFIYQTKILGFEPDFLGKLIALSAVVDLIAIALFMWLRAKYPQIHWKYYLYVSVGIGVIALLSDILFIMPAGTIAPLTYKSVAVWRTIIFGLVAAAPFLIPLALAGYASPKWGEGMTYAWFMSVINFGGFVSDIAGGFLYRILEPLAANQSFIFWFGFGNNHPKAVMLGLFIIISAVFTVLAGFLIPFLKIDEPERE